MGMDAATVTHWADDFSGMWEQIGDCFARRDLRMRATAYVQGLLGDVHRKNSWQLAEHVGIQTPHAFQRLLGRASWDADQLRDQVRSYAADHLLDDASGGVLIVDETGFLKKGDKSVGVQRQYSGTAGRIENCQVGVFLALASSRGRALIDRALYLPKSWSENQSRRREAGVPAEVSFATKPQLAVAMLRRALDAGMQPRWVLADEVYGTDSKTRRFLEDRGQPYVMAVTSQQRLWVNFKQRRVDAIIADVPDEQWQTHSIGEGAMGPRVYQWTGGTFGMPIEHQRGDLQNWLLVRRNVEEPTQRAYYFCAAPLDATLQDLAIAAGERWAIETCFQTAKQEVGLDAYEVRSWTGWHRHVTLSMLALAFLTAVRTQVREPTEKGALIWCR
jgi:SRSO17 transposase